MNLDLSKEVSKLKQEKLDLMNQKHESEMMLKEANEGLNEQKAEFELEKIKLKSELQAEHQEAIKHLEERMQKELAPKNTERTDLAVSITESVPYLNNRDHRAADITPRKLILSFLILTMFEFRICCWKKLKR